MEESARRILAGLIAFDTTSSKSNLECQEWIVETLGNDDADVEWIRHPTEPKASLLVRVGPAVAGGIVLSGHTDVVPVDGQAWSTNPYVLTERDGRLLGRGAVDMKGFVAMSVALAISLPRSRLRRPLWLALTYDEEIGCLGAQDVVDALARREERPSAVIVGEPTGMRPVDRHKGCSIVRLDVRGKAAHSSSPHLGASAIVPAARLVAFLDDYFAVRSRTGPFADGFEPACSTFNAGRIAGGNAVNIIPSECGLDFEFRDVPGDDADAILADISRFVADALLPRLQASDPAADISLERTIWCPSLEPEPGCEAVRLAHELTGFDVPGAVPFGTEAGFFQKAGYSTVVCGPGSIEQAHQPDEFISVADLRAGIAFMERLGQRLCG